MHSLLSPVQANQAAPCSQSTEESLEALRGELRSTRAAMDADAAALQMQVTHLRAAIGDEFARLASSQVSC